MQSSLKAFLFVLHMTAVGGRQPPAAAPLGPGPRGRPVRLQPHEYQNTEDVMTNVATIFLIQKSVLSAIVKKSLKTGMEHKRPAAQKGLSCIAKICV